MGAENRLFRTLDRVQDLAHAVESPLIVVHGDCPTGADVLADRWARRREPDVTVEPHPADWKIYGKAAGPRRNAHMVKLGADMCIAFLRMASVGTSNTIWLAQTCNIPTFIVNWEEAWNVPKRPYLIQGIPPVAIK